MAGKAKSIAECTEETKNPIIPIQGKGKESGKKIIFYNRARNVVKKITVDGCAITEGRKCDWLVVDSSDYEFFVELKGTAIVDACEQLSNSIVQLSASPTEAAKHSFIICSSFSPRFTTKIQIEIIRFKKRFNCTLVVKEKFLEVNI